MYAYHLGAWIFCQNVRTCMYMLPKVLFFQYQSKWGTQIKHWLRTDSYYYNCL